jgi:hypothetical protein
VVPYIYIYIYMYMYINSVCVFERDRETERQRERVVGESVAAAADSRQDAVLSSIVHTR